MATVNYAEAYERALAQAYPNVLNFGELYNVANNQTYKFVDAKTIHIPSISVTGRKNVNRDSIDGVFNRNVDNEWETKTLTFYREWSTSIDPADVMDTNMVLTIQNATKVFNETQKFPEKDAYTISKIYADWVAEGKTADTTALTVDNVSKRVLSPLSLILLSPKNNCLIFLLLFINSEIYIPPCEVILFFLSISAIIFLFSFIPSEIIFICSSVN